MSRILIASQPIAGHIYPLLPIVRELVARGHELRWYTGRRYRQEVEDAGAAFEPFVLARDFDDRDLNASFPGRAERRGLRQTQFDMRHIFVGQLEGQLRDLLSTLRHWPADAVLAEQTLSAGLLVSELGGPPCALLGILPLGIASRDTAPFGLGLLPDRSALGGWRNAGLHWAAQHLLFRDTVRELNAVCERLGVRRRPFAAPLSPHLMLQASVPGFEYALRDLPPQLHFIGALPPPGRSGALPEWWPELNAGRRVVLVTQGTLAVDPRQLVLPTLRGLAHENLLVVAAGVGELDDLPANARTARFVPFADLMPHLSAYVTNGGYGGVQFALSHGVPVVSAGQSEDKPEVGNRVAAAGVGVRLPTSTPTPGQVRRAVRRVLDDSELRQRASTLGHDFARYDAPTRAADLLERLAATGKPVYQGDLRNF
ncbi:glycosyltransferase [Deinococcus sp.]|uniref:glycosyltransferase n=1 Tax=Deinococcus sp. TaxID=47478 RepID=UPI0025E64D77|nr:glycosyltransferase [Deinococcus sp.]